MGEKRFNIRVETYLNRTLNNDLEAAVEETGLSKSQLLREGLRKRLQDVEETDNE